MFDFLSSALGIPNRRPTAEVHSTLPLPHTTTCHAPRALDTGTSSESGAGGGEVWITTPTCRAPRALDIGTSSESGARGGEVWITTPNPALNPALPTIHVEALKFNE